MRMEVRTDGDMYARALHINGGSCNWAEGRVGALVPAGQGRETPSLGQAWLTYTASVDRASRVANSAHSLVPETQLIREPVRYPSDIDSPRPESLKALLSFLCITTAGRSRPFITLLPYADEKERERNQLESSKRKVLLNYMHTDKSYRMYYFPSRNIP